LVFWVSFDVTLGNKIYLMPSRVKQHQLEDISRSKYSLSLPREWVMRDKDKDYGIDAEVEIFDSKGKATGIVYWVQLKATETKDKSAARKLDLRVDTIKYYKQLDLPVLIVRYSNNEDLFYCKWAHEVDLYYSKKNAKKFRVTFTEDDIWDDEKATKTEDYLRKLRAIASGVIALPAPINLNIINDSIGGMSRGTFLATYRKTLADYSHIFKDEKNSDNCLIHITIDNNDLIISLSSLTACTFHNILKISESEFVNEVIIHIALGLGSSLIKIGQNELAARIFLDDKIKNSFVGYEDIVSKFLPNLMSSSKYNEIIDMVCEVMDKSDNNFLESITIMSALVSLDKSNDQKRKKFLELQHKILEKSISLGDKSLIGASHYNLGNSYRNDGSCRKSIHYYILAKTHEPNYLRQIYYYQELAGSFFGCGKYRIAARLYKKAIDMGAEDYVKALYADALMFDGKYKLAENIFSDYLKSGDVEHAEWDLKLSCLSYLIETTGTTEQIRRISDAKSVIDITNTDTPKFVDKLEEAIELDNICGLAWFNMGIVHSKSGKHLEAAFSFLLCGLVQTRDIEAWVNATLCCLNKEVDIQFFPLVIHTAFFFNKDEYVLSLHKELEARLSGEMLNTMTNMIEKVLPKDNNRTEPPKIRLMGDDGIFRDVLSGKNS
jgi:tetratricopeptide (TPR) repeat protein